MTTKNEHVSDTADREIVITRLLNAPRELVFEVWTDPAHIAHWWGPDTFTTTIHSMDVKPGGQWRLTMHGYGRDFHNSIVFMEVQKPERLVFRHVPDEGVEPSTHHTIVTFDDKGSKTFITMRLIFDTATERERMANEYKAVEGGQQTIDKLDKYLSEVADENDLVITRDFNAPLDLVYKACTEPDRLAKWWGPKGFIMTDIKLDLRPGGIFHYCMKSPDGKEMWGKFVYREVVPLERIAFINSFSDKDGNIIKAPFFPIWPLEVWNVLTLTEHDGKTTLTLRGRPINATAEENKMFQNMRQGMQQGFGGSFDQLDEYLVSIAK